MGQTATEKMLEAASHERDVYAGDTIEVDVDQSWVHETQVHIFRDAFEALGGDVWDREKVMFMIDHFPTPTSQEQAENLREVERYAREKDVELVEVGIKHQAWRTLGVARPGAIMIGPDSHTPTAGALGAFATAVGPTDTAVIWKTGKTWLSVPETRRFDLVGELDDHVTPRDIGFHLLKRFGGETDYFAESDTVEYGGETVRNMDLDGRQTLCNMATEMGAMNAYIEPDDLLRRQYLDEKVTDPFEIHVADDDAEYAARHVIDVGDISPQIAHPHSPSRVTDLAEAEGIGIDQVFLGSCANGHLSDLEVAASILDGREIHDTVRMIVTPATDDIRRRASKLGVLDTFIRAGARVSAGYCSACPGYEGVLSAGERCLATSTRNYRGRMGHRESKIYLGSPAVVAASAITGEITHPDSVGVGDG